MPKLPPIVWLLPLANACGGGGSSSPVASNVPVEVLACRARVDDPLKFGEVALRDLRNLGSGRLADRTGSERGARLAPDGVRVAFARERQRDDPASRELFAAALDGSAAELRLTQNGARDDDPCWSPDGSRILFTSDRNGAAQLWVMSATGQDPEPFLPLPAGFADGEPDWHPTTDRVVWSRRDPSGHHRLWLANGNGFGAMPWTDGGSSAGDGTGDHAPTFSPDGTSVAFVRRVDAGRDELWTGVLGTGQVELLLAPDGKLATPRHHPNADEVWFGLAEPDVGRSGMRLAALSLGGGTPTLLWPDERWLLTGLDFVPTAPPPSPAGVPVRLDVEAAELQIAAASSVFGARSQLVDADGLEYQLRSETLETREIAGLSVRFDLPLAIAEQTLELRVRAVARTSRAGGDGRLRMSLYNPVEARFDTVVELPPDGTAPTTMGFRTRSLRHVARERRVVLTVIADLDPGDHADLWIDLVELVLVPIAGS